MESKKLQGLRAKLSRYEKEVAEADHENVKAYFELQVRIVNYDIEEAELSEKKRVVRRNIKRIIKMVKDLETLREETRFRDS